MLYESLGAYSGSSPVSTEDPASAPKLPKKAREPILRASPFAARRSCATAETGRSAGKKLRYDTGDSGS